MSNLRTSSNPWNIYSSDPNQGSQQIQDRWKGLGGGGASGNAISFGFVATAILISLFLIMAIFEHLYRPQEESAVEAGGRHLQKLRNPTSVPMTTYGSDFSVVMPGQQHPTYIAQPAPLLPCQREGICFPPNYHS